jgi:hypothetical protein
MNVQETTGTTTELDIRELTATELEYVSGGTTFYEFLDNFVWTFNQLTIWQDGCVVNCFKGS